MLKMPTRKNSVDKQIETINGEENKIEQTFNCLARAISSHLGELLLFS